jgi:hypothetical protein
MSGLLVLSATAWVGTPLRELIGGCRDGTYFDDVDGTCAKGGETPDFGGHSQAELEDLLRREGTALSQLRGVTAVGIDRHGIRVEVDADHDPIPPTLGGFAIHLMPSQIRVGADLISPQ